MGRRTWDSHGMPHPLPNRINYVFSNHEVPGARRLEGNPILALRQLEISWPNKIIWVIGGADLITQCRDILDRIELTCIAGTHTADVKLDLRFLDHFNPVQAKSTPGTNCTFISYEKVPPRP